MSGTADSTPSSNPGEQRYGTAATFEQARAAFEAAWRDYLPNRTEADFEEWRQDAAWHAAKYARWDQRDIRTNSRTTPRLFLARIGQFLNP